MRALTATLTAVLVALAAALTGSPNARRAASLVAALVGRRIPGLRPFLPALAGDGREEAAAAFVLTHSPPGNVTAAMAAFEEYATHHAWMMAVGPKKGAIIAAALADAGPASSTGTGGGHDPAMKILELGTYCGYGAMLLASAAPSARVYTVEVDPRFAAVARTVLGHAGLLGSRRVTVLEGPLARHLASLGAADPPGAPLDFVFVDHAKEAYVPDVEALLGVSTPAPLVRAGARGGTVIAADNLRVPGAPEYVAWLARPGREGRGLRTVVHRAELEFVRGIPDAVSVSRVVDRERALVGRGWGGWPHLQAQAAQARALLL
jgi:catechol O-methyltransferase